MQGYSFSLSYVYYHNLVTHALRLAFSHKLEKEEVRALADRISLCLIVKDEAAYLARAIESSRAAADEIIVVDTGSRDDSLSIAHRLGAKVFHFRWRGDFSAARNFALEQAAGEWILFLDADEEFAGEDAQKLREIVATTDAAGYFFKIINFYNAENRVEQAPDVVFRFFRNHPDHRYEGRVHEQIIPAIMRRNPEARFAIREDITLFHYGYLDANLTAKRKRERNLQLMEQEAARFPDDPVVNFHLGVEYFRQGDYPRATQAFLRAAAGSSPGVVYGPKLLKYLVQSLYLAGEKNEALRVATNGLAVYPDHPYLHFARGVLLFEKRDYAAAQEAFLQARAHRQCPAYYAVEEAVTGYQTLFYLGRCAEERGDLEEALAHYLAAVRENTEFVPAVARIVHILNPREYPEDAVESLNRVFDLSAPRARRVLAEIFLAEGAAELARRFLQAEG